jgi:hypothetical protein
MAFQEYNSLMITLFHDFLASNFDFLFLPLDFCVPLPQLV